MRAKATALTEWGRGGLVAVLLCVFGMHLVHVARIFSATWDESHHLFDGYNIWERHDYRLNAEVPPFVKLAAAVPLLRMRLTTPPSLSSSQAADAFLRGRAFVFGNGGDRVLFRARMVCACFAVVTALLVYLAGRRMFGFWAGVMGLFLFVFDPNVLANGTLVTTDTGSACLFFASVYAFYRYATKPSAWWLVMSAVAAGLTVVAKYTGILLGPMLLLLVVGEGVLARSWVVFGRRFAAVVLIGVCAWGMIWAFYGFRYKAAPGGLELSPSLGPYLASMPDPRDGVRLAVVAKYRLLPEGYIWGLANTKKTEWEYTSYFFGKVYRHGPWEYFPAAFLIKSTLPLLLLLVAAPFVPWGSGGRYRREFLYLLVPVGVYFAVVTSSHFDIGARHLLPIYPFLYVLAAGVAVRLAARGRGWAVLVGMVVLWQAVTTMRAAPAYMAYGNELWGGPGEVHRYLSDANVDWGQQLKAVRAYLEVNHVTDCWFGYFPDGAIEPSDYGISCKRLPTGTSLDWLKLPMEVPPVISGTVLLSDSVLEDVEFGDGPLNPYDSFRGLKPVAVIQGGVDVYRGRFAVPLAAALVEVRRSGELASLGRRDEALRIALEAEGLAPGSARVELNAAERLGEAGRWREALGRYGVADGLVMTVRPELEDGGLAPAIAEGMVVARGRLGAGVVR